MSACAAVSACGMLGSSKYVKVTPYSQTNRAIIAANEKSQPALMDTHVHVVQSGDALYLIADKYRVPLRDIIQINNMTPPYILHPGQKIIVPAASFHIVKKGDTLSQLARDFGVGMHDMVRLNKMDPPYLLQIGQRLLV
ncbi:MAG: LysM domain-containing protein, partial [Pseudomonadota bacterium]